MKLVINLYNDGNINENPLPETREDLLYREELLKISKKYPIKSMKLVPDYDNDFQYLYLFKTEKELEYGEIDRIESELNEHMDDFGEKLGFKPMKYAILEDI